jgi:hypothetical protein
MITIENLREKKPTEPWEIKVDRGSHLGNPTKMHSDYVRNLVCDEYEKYFYSMVKNSNTDSAFKDALSALAEIYKEYGKLALFCWCAPKRCHAETIREYLLDRCRATTNA